MTNLTRKSVEEQIEHDPEGHERLQVHKRRRDVEHAVEVDRVPLEKEMRATLHLWSGKLSKCWWRQLLNLRL